MRRLVDYIYDGGLESGSRLRGMSKHWHWIINTIDRGEFLQRLLDSERSEAGIFSVMMQVYADHKGKPIMVKRPPRMFAMCPPCSNGSLRARSFTCFATHAPSMCRNCAAGVTRRIHSPISSCVRPDRCSHSISCFKHLCVARKHFTFEQVTSIDSAFQRIIMPSRLKTWCVFPRPNCDVSVISWAFEFQDTMLKMFVMSKGFATGQVGFDARAADRWRTQITP